MSSNCTTYLDIHKEGGSNQISRDNAALHPSYADIDNRSFEDLVRFTAKLSDHIKFYNQTNIISGNWHSFFNHDITAVLCFFNEINIEESFQKFSILKKELAFEKDNIANQLSIVDDYFEDLKNKTEQYKTRVVQIPTDFYLFEYYQSATEKLNIIIDSIDADVQSTSNLYVLFQNKIFLNKFSALFGILNEWKTKSTFAIAQTLESYPKHTPHYALFLSFLKLYQEAQKELNGFTKKHLDFYYKEVLQLQPKIAQPDFVHLCIEPNKNVAPFLISKNTLFLAGKNPDGKSRYYAALQDTTINHAQVAHVFSLYKNENQLWCKDWSKDNGKLQGFDAFSDGEIPHVGYAIASSKLLLQSGKRTLTFTNGSVDLDLSSFQLFVTGKKGWIEISESIKNTFVIEESEEAIVGFDAEIHKGIPFHTHLPILKIITKTGLDTLNFQNITLEIQVENCKHFKLFNPFGEVDVNKNFFPFGEYPENGMAMLFTSNEFFQKKNATGKIDFVSDNLYTSIIALSFLENGNWVSSTEKIDSFENVSAIPYTNKTDQYIAQDSTNGYLKLSLEGTKYNAGVFMKEYYAAAANMVITNTSTTNNTIQTIFTANTSALPTPYKISKFTFGYKTSLTLLSTDKDEVQLLKILPFGYQSFQDSDNENEKGSIYIGLESAISKSTVHLLMQVLEGSSNPLKEINSLAFQYLVNNNWQDIFDCTDQSLNLTQSGILSCMLPELNSAVEQTKMPENLFWFRINIPTDLDAICNLVGFHTQAIKAQLYDADNNGLSFVENIDIGVISKLYTTIPSVKKVHQLYPSFGGKLREDEVAFNIRNSETLRHKNRAITSWDYEHLILANFPEVQEVKCLNHFRYEQNIISNTSAGYVTLIPIAKTLDSQKNDFLKPFVHQNIIQKISAFLQGKTSPHVKVLVKNPKLEYLSLECNLVKMSDDWDDIYVKNEINESLKKFLCPWLSSPDFEFSGNIQKATIIQLIDSLPFVDYLSDFKITKSMDGTSEVVDEIVPSTVFSVFVPGTHIISIKSEKCCEQ